MLAAVLDLHLSKVGSPAAQDMKENMFVDNIFSAIQRMSQKSITNSLMN